MQLVTTFSSLPSPAITMSTPHTSHLAQTRNRHRVNRLYLLANRRLRRRLLFRARVARALTLVHVVNAALLNATHRTTRLHRVKRPESDASGLRPQLACTPAHLLLIPPLASPHRDSAVM